MTDDTKPDHEAARAWVEHVLTVQRLSRQAGHGHLIEVDRKANAARAYLASQAENARERQRGDALNARNGRMEHEMSLLKPESQAKAFMEAAYAEMQERVRELEAALVAVRPNMFCKLSGHVCNSDTRMVGAPPCCEPCRTHLAVSRVLATPGEWT